ncbi:MAG: hypothetical protein IT464_09220 [Planctomycetes bacterium]|nr:hypothetical protein [Planctomycetota bacterium]
MKTTLPRIVVITRPTPLDMLLRRFGTQDNARFYVESRGQDFARVLHIHELQQQAVTAVLRAIPAEQRRAQVSRDDLDRFLFNRDDVVFAIGQDGLVPNVAKYLDGHTLVGFNPDPATVGGLLCRFTPAESAAVIAALNAGTLGGFVLERRTMVVAVREDGQQLLALNELFIGHHSHQSAKYRISVSGPDSVQSERHSSSGVIVSTGTGATGWTASIVKQRGIAQPLPAATERRLAYMVREPWPSIATGTEVNFGFVTEGETLTLSSEMEEGGVVFGDGIEADFIEFNEGQTITVRLADRTLNLLAKS